MSAYTIFRELRSRPLLSKLTSRNSLAGIRLVRTVSSLPSLPIFKAIANHDAEHTAVIHSKSGRSFNYGNILADVVEAKEKLLQLSGKAKLDGQRIAFLVENGYDYVVTLLSILGANAIAIPLSPNFPSGELQYILEQSESMMLLSSKKFSSKAEAILKEGLDKSPIHGTVEKNQGHFKETRFGRNVHFQQGSDIDQAAMMLYTSGTTARPKGVLIPERTLTAQAQALMKAWNYSPRDHLLHVLPLHHIHGTVNAIITPLFAGSTMEFMFPFNPDAVWNRFAAPFVTGQGKKAEPITFFTAVPTIYNRLLSSYEGLPPELQKPAQEGISPEHLRLCISGSAALPTPVKMAWKRLSNGNVLLERYGMTEVGMALSCGLDFKDRVDGSVGWPLPSVEARLVDTDTGKIIEEGEEYTRDGKEITGEVQLRGPTIFKEYWRNPEATKKEFVDGEDGKGKWFKTGDIALRRNVEGAGASGDWTKGPMWFIQGRKSADIIKTGGEKVSALEVERELLSLPQVAEAAVVGLPSEQWGQKVAAVIVLKPDQIMTGKAGKPWGIMDMRRALASKLANYKIPQEMKILNEGLPRNAMGKSKP